jgi:hypothetical protein
MSTILERDIMPNYVKLYDLDAGTGVAVEDEPTLTMGAQANGAELLLFDLP